MRYKGKLTTWKDDQGFGFATTHETSERVFVHIKNFSYKTRRPVDGDEMIYNVEQGTKKNLQATNIQFLHDYERQRLRDQRHQQQEGGKNLLSKIAAYPFILTLLVLFLTGQISVWVLVYYAVINLITFFAYWQDKQSAQNNKRRTPEQTLHNLSLFGGWIGALVAQLSLRHKSQKQEFRKKFWLTTVIHIIFFGIYLIMK